MFQVLLGSILLSIIHALIPNHWLPVVAIGKSENWSQRRTLLATAITGTAHNLSTILIGVLVGAVGYKLSSGYEFVATIAAPTILVALGIVFIILDLRGKHHHHYGPNDIKTNVNGQTEHSRWKSIVTSLSIAMFLTPCLEIEAYYFQAGIYGWPGIIMVSAVYLTITLFVMLLLVYLMSKGIRKAEWHFLEHHEKILTGIVLIGLGIFSYFVQF